MEKQFIDEVEIKGVTYDISDTTTRETKADKATTLKGYGITDAYTKTEIDSELSKKLIKKN